MPEEKQVNFEKSMQKLTEIVESLESGDLTLDESLKQYEEGVKLSQACMRRLQEAQQKVERLVRTSSGGLATEELDEADLKPKKKSKKK